jgi:glycosyltransferase involved in cell wall biosynthesis
MRILIVSPFLNNIGGTEIEAIYSTIFLSQSNIFKDVYLFSPLAPSNDMLNKIVYDHGIKVFSYPALLNSPNILRLDNKIKRNLNLSSSPLKFLYWYSKRRKYDKIYILTSQTLEYSLPILKAFDDSKITMKFTMFQQKAFSNKLKKYLAKVHFNIVMSKDQKNFFNQNFGLTNVLVQDIFTPNENNLLKVNSRRTYDFGVFGRLSKEKQIEDAIILIRKLQDMGICSSLLIQGIGDLNYLKYLNTIILEKELQNFITINYESLSPTETELFFNQISTFLITSVSEGGPITGLEAMASGIPVLCYNVGAMSERLGKYQWLVAEDHEQLFKSAMRLLNLPERDYKKLSNSLRNIYLNEHANQNKLEKLKKILG